MSEFKVGIMSNTAVGEFGREGGGREKQMSNPDSMSDFRLNEQAAFLTQRNVELSAEVARLTVELANRQAALDSSAADLAARKAERDAEHAALRDVIKQCGGFAAPEASTGFVCQAPDELRLVILALKASAEKAERERDGLALSLVNSHRRLEQIVKHLSNDNRVTSDAVAHKIQQIIDDEIGTSGLNELAAIQARAKAEGRDQIVTRAANSARKRNRSDISIRELQGMAAQAESLAVERGVS